MNTYWKNVKKYATTKQAKCIDLSQELGSNAKAAAELNIDRRGVDRQIDSAVTKALEAGVILDNPEHLKILLFDIETAPLEAYIWSMWSEVRSIDFIEKDWYMLSYSYKWLDNETVYGKSLQQCTKYGKYKAGTEDDRELVEDLWKLWNEADIIVGHNGDNFDVKKVKARMLQHVMIPTSPYRTVDTLKILKREFGLTSNKLDYAAKFLFGEGKIDTGGIDLWRGCLHGDLDAWKLMLDYNKTDVNLLERVYKRIRSWDRSHPNVTVLSEEEGGCTVCGSTDIRPIKGKYAATNVSTFQAFRCNDCGHVLRGRKNERSKEQLKATFLNAR